MGRARRDGIPAAAFRTLFVVCVLVGAARAPEAGETEPLWEAVRTGQAFAMMRHALAPGTGDPANFSLGDCATQRNLDDRGRRQAAEIGARFREHGITRAEVFSSAWCRCRDTAELLGLGPVRTLPALNSIFGRPERREPQTTALEAWLAGHKTDGPLVLVTHQVNIRALTGSYTRSGETVVLRRERDGKITVLGKL